jgi:hypothetical protein
VMWSGLSNCPSHFLGKGGVRTGDWSRFEFWVLVTDLSVTSETRCEADLDLPYPRPSERM